MCMNSGSKHALRDLDNDDGQDYYRRIELTFISREQLEFVLVDLSEHQNQGSHVPLQSLQALLAVSSSGCSPT